jgi:hypothetical protein
MLPLYDLLLNGFDPINALPDRCSALFGLVDAAETAGELAAVAG